MRFTIRTCRAALLLAALVLALPALAQTPRILYVGDSWTAYPWSQQSPPALREVLARPEVGLGAYVEDGSIALLQPTAAGWNTPESKAAIAGKLTEFPTIDTVHLSLGGNDVNLGLGGNFSPEHIASMNSAAVQHISEVIDFILAQRPDMRVAICGYDYLNIFEGIKFNGFGVVQSMENPTAVAYALYGLGGLTIADAAANQDKVNDVFIDLEQRKLTLAQGRDRVEYIHSFGLMQAVFGIPSLSVPPNVPGGLPAGSAGGYANFPGGNRDLFSPRQAMAGSSELDPIHLNPSGYTRLMENAVLQVYAAWLGDSTAPQVTAIAPYFGKDAGGSVDFNVTFSEPVTGVDSSDFAITANGVADAAVSGVAGSGASYVVTVTYGAGQGTLRLDLVDDGTIYDAVWNTLGETNLVHAAGDGSYSLGTPVEINGTPLEGEDPIEGEGTSDGEGEGSTEGETPVEGEGEPVCETPAKTKRVLIVGDSWTAGIWAVNAMDEVFEEYGLTHIGSEGTLTAQSGSKAAQWANETTFKNYIIDSLIAYPTIDTVHLVIGGNDILSRIKDTDVYSGIASLQREGWWDTIQNDVQTIVNFCLAFPQIEHVVINDYDYLNRTTAELVLGTLFGQDADFGGMSQEQVNNAFLTVGQRKMNVAQNTPGCEYVQNWGIMQHHFQLPAGVPFPGAAPLYTPYPGGNKAFPMPDAAFDPIVIGPITVPGDGIHPNENAHKVFLRNAVEQYYLGWFAPELECPEEGEGPVEGAVDGEIPVDGEEPTDGEGSVDGELPAEGEGATDGEDPAEGDGAIDGELPAEGEDPIEGEAPIEGETPIDGEVPTEGEDPVEGENPVDGETPIDGELPTDGEIPAEGEGEPTDGEASEGEGDLDGEEEVPTHSADYNGDGRIDLAEILRCIQLYNFGTGFGCGTDEDGFGLSAADRESCLQHALDYLEPHWVLTLSELLRGVQLYNLGDIVPCDTAEDGFCPL